MFYQIVKEQIYNSMQKMNTSDVQTCLPDSSKKWLIICIYKAQLEQWRFYMNFYASKAYFSILCEKHCFITVNSLVLMGSILYKMHVLNLMGECTTGYECIHQNTSL